MREKCLGPIRLSPLLIYRSANSIITIKQDFLWRLLSKQTEQKTPSDQDSFLAKNISDTRVDISSSNKYKMLEKKEKEAKRKHLRVHEDLKNISLFETRFSTKLLFTDTQINEHIAISINGLYKPLSDYTQKHEECQIIKHCAQKKNPKKTQHTFNRQLVMDKSFFFSFFLFCRE